MGASVGWSDIGYLVTYTIKSKFKRDKHSNWLTVKIIYHFNGEDCID